MRKRGFWRNTLLVLISVFLLVGGAGTANAVTSSSTHYQVTDAQFNAGSTLQSCSGQYCSTTSIGDTAVGSSASSVQTAQFGQISNSDPLLEVIVTAGVSDLGVLSTQSTASKTMSVKVRNYLSGGYVMQILGTPPKYNGHTLQTDSTPVASQAGTEQFGMNVVANTTPNLGADPVQVPSDQVSFGIVDPNYRTANKFMYNNGNTVAKSTTSSGETDYTISMIVNISNATPAGHYSGDFSAVVIPSY